MNLSRTNSLLLGGALALLLAGVIGFVLGSNSASDSSDAAAAREEGYQLSYDTTLAKVEAASKQEGVAAGRKRGKVAGTKTGLREGFDIGSGYAGLQAAEDGAAAAVAAQAAAESELADRRANCGSIPRAPDICPTSSELSSYQAAVIAARQARQAATNAED